MFNSKYILHPSLSEIMNCSFPDYDCREETIINMDEKVKKITASSLNGLYQKHEIRTHLQDIKDGNVDNWRHKVFFNLKRTEKNIRPFHLGHYFDTGGFNDSQIEELSDLIVDDQNLLDCSTDYKIKVLLPELLIKLTERICNCNRDLAEKYMCEGSKIDLEAVWKRKEIKR